MMRILIALADLVVWLLSAGFGGCGLLCMTFALACFEREDPEPKKKRAARVLAAFLTVTGLLSFAAFVGLAVWAYSIYRTL